MSADYKPPGHNAAAPYLVVDDANRVIEFLSRAFNAVELMRHPAPDGSGRIMHAEVRIDDSVIMLGDSAEGWPPLEAHVHVYVPDVDETYRRALEAGGVSVQAPVKKQDPDKRGGVKGPSGVTWWMATRME
jgi:uncharacterized glyoxalase superfamily protein PhnB